MQCLIGDEFLSDLTLKCGAMLGHKLPFSRSPVRGVKSKTSNLSTRRGALQSLALGMGLTIGRCLRRNACRLVRRVEVTQNCYPSCRGPAVSVGLRRMGSVLRRIRGGSWPICDLNEGCGRAGLSRDRHAQLLARQSFSPHERSVDRPYKSVLHCHSSPTVQILLEDWHLPRPG